MQVLGFDDRDLAANHRGTLSNAQRWRFYGAEFAKEGAWIAAVVVIAIIWRSLNPSPEDRTLANPAYVMPLLFIGIIVVFRIAMRAIDVYTLRQNPVESINGVARKELNVFSRLNKRPVTSYNVYIGPELFVVTKELHWALDNEALYTIYYRPTTREILSIEAFD